MLRFTVSSFGLAALLLPALSAQGTIVSPVGAATVEGSSSSGVPFNTTGARRMLQVHGDLGTTPRAFTKLAFRMNAGTTNYTGTRTLDMELFMGPSVGPAAISFFFANNFIGTPTTAIARRTINFGPQGQAVTPGPNPFTSAMDLPLDAPFAYAGTGPIAWDYLQYANTVAGTFSSLDGDLGSNTSTTSTITGTGCTCTGRTSAMTHGVSLIDVGGKLAINFTVTGGPGTAPVVLALGATNPNTPFPGLCSNLYTDLLFQLPIGTTSAAGAITSAEAGAATLVLQNNFAGATLFSQTHGLDTGRVNELPLCNSNGRTFTIPTPNLTKVVDVSRIYNNSTTATPIEGQFISTFTVGFGLVTEFTHQ